MVVKLLHQLLVYEICFHYLFCTGKVDKKELLSIAEGAGQSVWTDSALETAESSFENVSSSVRAQIWELWKVHFC